MCYYVGVNALKNLLQRQGVETFITKLVSYLEADFKAWDSFEKAPRVASHSDVGVIELMPISNKTLYGFKYVNGHPANTHKGLLTVTAFGALADVETGYPLLLSEMTILTALRTAATSALVAKYMVRDLPRVHALIGCGAQSEFQALAMKTVLGVSELRVYDIDKGAMEKLAKNLAPYAVNITLCTSVSHAVERADIITTATAAKTRATILTSEIVQEGVHINAIGGDCPGKTELHPDVLKRSKIVVEFEPQSRIEGEIQQNPALSVVQLADILNGKQKLRTSNADITVFDSVGFALEDFSVLRLVYDLVKNDPDIASDLIPTPVDPKNIFGLI